MFKAGLDHIRRHSSRIDPTADTRTGKQEIPSFLFHHQASRKLLVTQRTKRPAYLRFFAGHFRLSLDIFKLRMTGKQRFLSQTFFGHRTFWPAIKEVFAGHFQNSTDMSGEFREACITRMDWWWTDIRLECRCPITANRDIIQRSWVLKTRASVPALQFQKPLTFVTIFK